MENTNNNSDLEIETLKKIRAYKSNDGDGVDPITMLKEYHQAKLKDHGDIQPVMESIIYSNGQTIQYKGESNLTVVLEDGLKGKGVSLRQLGNGSITLEW